MTENKLTERPRGKRDSGERGRGMCVFVFECERREVVGRERERERERDF